MAEGTPSGWLPPKAPGAGPRPRFDAPPPEPRPRFDAPEPVVPAPSPEPAQAQAQARPTFVRERASGERNGTAAWAVVLGSVGLALLVLSLGSLFIVTLPCSIAAWVLAARARGQIASGATARGQGQATAALWLGRIGVVAGVAAFVVFVALLAAGFDFEQFRDDLQRELDRQRERQNDDAVRTGLQQLRAAVAVWPAR